MSDDLKNIVEAVLLASDAPVGVARIQGLFDDDTRPEAGRIHEAMTALEADYADRGVELKKIGSGYRFQTREKYAEYLRKLHAVRPPRLSRALLETLSIIAYRQPVTRGDIEEVRGVAVSADIMQRLQERGWIKEVGVRDVPGRPALFGTTPEFLSYFSLGSLKDLPDLAEQRDLMDIAGEMETPLPEEVLAALRPVDDAEADSGETADGVADEMAEGEGPAADDTEDASPQATDPRGDSEDSLDAPEADEEPEGVVEEATNASGG